MIQQNKIIQASDDMMLTNGDTYAKKVALGKFDDKDNWQEITLEEYFIRTQAEESL